MLANQRRRSEDRDYVLKVEKKPRVWGEASSVVTVFSGEGWGVTVEELNLCSNPSADSLNNAAQGLSVLLLSVQDLRAPCIIFY